MGNGLAVRALHAYAGCATGGVRVEASPAGERRVLTSRAGAARLRLEGWVACGEAPAYHPYALHLSPGRTLIMCPGAAATFVDAADYPGATSKATARVEEGEEGTLWLASLGHPWRGADAAH